MGGYIEHDIVIQAPIERVWDLLTQPAHVAAWYAFDGAEIETCALGVAWYSRGKNTGRFMGASNVWPRRTCSPSASWGMSRTSRRLRGTRRSWSSR